MDNSVRVVQFYSSAHFIPYNSTTLHFYNSKSSPSSTSFQSSTVSTQLIIRSVELVKSFYRLFGCKQPAFIEPRTSAVELARSPLTDLPQVLLGGVPERDDVLRYGTPLDIWAVGYHLSRSVYFLSGCHDGCNFRSPPTPKCCKMNAYLQNSASIQPRTSLPKFLCDGVSQTGVAPVIFCQRKHRYPRRRQPPLPPLRFQRGF